MPESAPLPDFDIIRQSEHWADEPTLEGYVQRVWHVLAPDIDGHISFAFADDVRVQTLNKEWRGKDKATNVLSFPDGDEGDGGVIHLGDIIFAYETITREADAQGTCFDNHLTHLIVHGILHLLGYDHIDQDEAEEMEALEIQILAKLGIDNPYQDTDPD